MDIKKRNKIFFIMTVAIFSLIALYGINFIYDYDSYIVRAHEQNEWDRKWYPDTPQLKDGETTIKISTETPNDYWKLEGFKLMFSTRDKAKMSVTEINMTSDDTYNIVSTDKSGEVIYQKSMVKISDGYVSFDVNNLPQGYKEDILTELKKNHIAVRGIYTDGHTSKYSASYASYKPRKEIPKDFKFEIMPVKEGENKLSLSTKSPEDYVFHAAVFRDVIEKDGVQYIVNLYCMEDYGDILSVRKSTSEGRKDVTIEGVRNKDTNTVDFDINGFEKEYKDIVLDVIKKNSVKVNAVYTLEDGKEAVYVKAEGIAYATLIYAEKKEIIYEENGKELKNEEMFLVKGEELPFDKNKDININGKTYLLNGDIKEDEKGRIVVPIKLKASTEKYDKEKTDKVETKHDKVAKNAEDIVKNNPDTGDNIYLALLTGILLTAIMSGVTLQWIKNK